MGLGNDLDEAPPGVTEDHQFYDERVIDGGDDALEADFFLFDEGGSDSPQGGWTEMTESDEAVPGGGEEFEGNGWAEAVESDHDLPGRGKGRGRDGDSDEEGAEGADTLEAFDQDAEDFPDQSDW